MGEIFKKYGPLALIILVLVLLVWLYEIFLAKYFVKGATSLNPTVPGTQTPTPDPNPTAGVYVYEGVVAVAAKVPSGFTVWGQYVNGTFEPFAGQFITNTTELIFPNPVNDAMIEQGVTLNYFTGVISSV